MRRVRLLVLDEAHVYDGVFGTSMAYFLRRFRAFSQNHQIICCTATVGEPSDFMEKLVGRTMRIFDIDDDTSARPQKTILLRRNTGGNSFENTVELLKRISDLNEARFLAFGDSRKMVERIVAATFRQRPAAPNEGETEGEANDEDIPSDFDLPSLPRILPYRAGYEAEDRREIQNALSRGGLSGVVATSALELGLDIGEIICYSSLRELSGNLNSGLAKPGSQKAQKLKSFFMPFVINPANFALRTLSVHALELVANGFVRYWLT
jgi:DEAD/DEAH box helicase domain-containing protein